MVFAVIPVPQLVFINPKSDFHKVSIVWVPLAALYERGLETPFHTFLQMGTLQQKHGGAISTTLLYRD
jgi:hypothetical protein